ncbi:MAG: type VI secretion system protein TssA [Alteromonadaceae bacterium]|nr:MAG: type VI secretion system protein TssA [Alteromonadaceae bacterium]
MASPVVIDINDLLQPVNDDAPSGEDIRDNPSPTSDYQTVKAARNQARAAERQNIHDGESIEAIEHWQKIVELTPKILKEQAKDLEIASWYTEAVTRVHGFSGLRDAFDLIDGLIENFWDTLHPMPDEFGIETRVACLSGLNGEGAEGVLIAPLRRLALTEARDPGPFSLWQYKQAVDAQKISDDRARNNKIENLGFKQEDIEDSVSRTSSEFYVDLRDDVSRCIDTYKAIGVKLNEKCDSGEAPATRNIIEVLEDCLRTVNHIGKLKFPIEATEDADEEAQEANAEDGTSVVTKVVVAKGPIASRDDAFKQLLEIADYFRKSEPHSPVSYILQKAVKWGNMPLGELIGELITDDSSRERFSELTGVETPED